MSGGGSASQAGGTVLQHGGGKASQQAAPWYFFDAAEPCRHCGKADYAVGAPGPRTLLCCGCCQAGWCHVECVEAETGATLDREVIEGGSNWFCSEVGAA